MMCQAISTTVADAISSFTQATTPPTGQGGGGRGIRGDQGVNPKKVAVPGNFNRCGKAGHYLQGHSL